MKEFNYKKVIIILVALLVIQIIIYAITNAVMSKDNKGINQAPDTPVSRAEDREYLKQLDVAYADQKEEIINPANLSYYYNDKFASVVSMTELQKSLYKLVNEGLPTIYNATKDKTRTEVSNFYKTDYAKINNCGIMDEETYGYIGKDLVDQIYKGRNTFKSVEMDYESIKPNQNGYMTVEFKVHYTNEATIKMIACLAEREGVSPKIKYQSNSDLKKLFEKYKGEIVPDDFTEKLKELAENISDIKVKTKLKSNNYRKQYYNDNIEKFSNLGIVSENDFMNLARAISNETLISDSFYNYIIKLDTVKELDDRYELKLNLVFLSGQEYNFDVKMYKAKNAAGRLMEFKSSLYNDNYSDTNAE